MDLQTLSIFCAGFNLAVGMFSTWHWIIRIGMATLGIVGFVTKVLP